MMKAAAIAALVIPVFCAAGADYSADLQSARERADKMTEQIAQVESELKAFGVELPSAGQPAEQETVKEGEDTQVTSELGMFLSICRASLRIRRRKNPLSRKLLLRLQKWQMRWR